MTDPMSGKALAAGKPMTYEQFIQTVGGLAGQINELHLQLAESQRSTVDQLIRERSRDIAAIERSLDHLLDAAAHPVGLRLFRRLCQYYWTIDPEATATYVLAYRDMWVEEVEPCKEGPQ